MDQTRIVVLGAGVSGLTTAKYLLESSLYADVTIVAKHVPGDWDSKEYCSPAAGANFLLCNTFERPNTRVQHFEAMTWKELARLAKNVPEAGICFQGSVPLEELNFFNSFHVSDVLDPDGCQLAEQDPWYANVLPGFERLQKDQLPDKVEAGIKFRSVCIDPSLHLHWLLSQCLQMGARVKRGIVNHVADAALLHVSGSKADIVINCTGISSRHLGGVEDDTVTAASGQTVLVRNELDAMYSLSNHMSDPDESTYLVPRSAGGGTLIGGFNRDDTDNISVDLQLADRMLKNAVDLCPQLLTGTTAKDLDVVRHQVGLRPNRRDGPRVERELVNGVQVIHNYGHGPGGYQTAIGCADMVKQLAAAIC